MPESTKRIAITSGDPAGVGPELCLQYLEHLADSPTNVQPIIFGDASAFRRVAQQLKLGLPKIHLELSDALAETSPAILDFANPLASLQPGVVSADTGRAAYQYIETAIKAAVADQVDAIVTAPIHKEALHMAGVPYPGHTEILADQTNAPQHCMMLTSQEITCSLVTAHVGLDEVSPLLNTESILQAIELSNDAMRRMRGRDVRLVVCGLNPHAGEGGLFGNKEEERIITPAITAAQAKGIDVVGPLPPDTAFTAMNRATTDCYICMYHDQGLIPLKAIAFDTAVNVTLGLPIVRTSVDHGTALDIAWQGKARLTSFIEAVNLAVRLAEKSTDDA